MHNRTLVKSGAVGVVATIVDLGLLTLLVEWVGATPIQANAPALVAGLLVQFFGNKLFAFGDRSKDYLRQGSWFLVIEAGAFALNAGLFHLLASLAPTVPYLLARMLVSAGVYFGFSYPLWGRVFEPCPQTQG